jgi:hypothetical protein
VHDRGDLRADVYPGTLLRMRTATGSSRTLGALALAISLFGCRPSSTQHVGLASPLVIPVEVRNGLVLIHAEMNGRAAVLILDTGSGVSVLDTAFAREAQMEGTGQNIGLKGSSNTSARLGTVRSVALSGAHLSNLLVAAVPLDAVRATVGHDVQGTLGYDVFDQFVVTVDYAARTVTLTEPSSFVYHGSGIVVPIVLYRRLPIVTGQVSLPGGESVPARLQLDLGASNYALRLATPFVREHGLNQDTASRLGLLGIGVGGITEGRVLRLPSLMLAGLVVRNPTVALSHEADGALGLHADADGAIGAQVFSRSRLILDYSRQRAILEPRTDFSTPDASSLSGVSVREEEAPMRTIRVAYVVPGSAGGEAGLRAGDRVTQIGSVQVSAITIQTIAALLRTQRTPLTIVVDRDGVTQTIVVRPRPTI